MNTLSRSTNTPLTERSNNFHYNYNNWYLVAKIQTIILINASTNPFSAWHTNCRYKPVSTIKNGHIKNEPETEGDDIKLEELPEDMDPAQGGRNVVSSPLMEKIVKNGHAGSNEEPLTTTRKSAGSLEQQSSHQLESTYEIETSHELLMYYKETIHSLTRLYKNVEAGEKS